MDPREVLTRPGPQPDAVMRYGDLPDQLLDVHLPAWPTGGGDPAEVVVLLHGGFWRHTYDRRHTRPLAQGLTGAGFVVVTAEYRRTGAGGGWPQTFDDVAAALDALPRLADVVPGRARLGEPPLLLGHSTGGHLAMWVALRPGAPAVRGVVGLAPVADLREGYERHLGADAVLALMGGTPAQVPDAYAAADPARMLPPTVPLTVVHGEADDRVPVQMSRALAAPGSGITLVQLGGVEHFALIDPLSPAWPYVLTALRAV